jgi:hypothetical protein
MEAFGVQRRYAGFARTRRGKARRFARADKMRIGDFGGAPIPRSAFPKFRNPQFEIPHSDPHFPNSAIRNPQFAIRNPQSLPPLVFWVFALQFLFDLWIGLFPEV